MLLCLCNKPEENINVKKKKKKMKNVLSHERMKDHMRKKNAFLPTFYMETCVCFFFFIYRLYRHTDAHLKIFAFFQAIGFSTHTHTLASILESFFRMSQK